MDAFWTSAVAVLGTLLGAWVSYAFQRRASDRGERFARSEALRQERITTYSAFASAAEEYRHGQATRWHTRLEDPHSAASREARDETHRLRTAARQALYRVRLLTDDADALRGAEHAYRTVWDVSNATDQAGHDTRDARASEAIEAFVAAAAPLVR